MHTQKDMYILIPFLPSLAQLMDQVSPLCEKYVS